MAGSKKTKTKKTQGRFPKIHRSAAGIDVGSKFHVVAVPPDRSDPVRSFDSFTGELHRLADWLRVPAHRDHQDRIIVITGIGGW